MSEPRDPKLDDMMKGAKIEQPAANIFTITINYNVETNGCRISHPVGENGEMFWAAIHSAMSEARIMFERMRMMEMDKQMQVQKKSSLVIAPAGSVPRT